MTATILPFERPAAKRSYGKWKNTLEMTTIANEKQNPFEKALNIVHNAKDKTKEDDYYALRATVREYILLLDEEHSKGPNPKLSQMIAFVEESMYAQVRCDGGDYDSAC